MTRRVAVAVVIALVVAVVVAMVVAVVVAGRSQLHALVVDSMRRTVSVASEREKERERE